MEYPIFINAIKVKQPFGEFYVASFRAKDIVNLTFSDPLRFDEEKKLKGSQRPLEEKKRVKSITSYINGNDTAFPNSIIIAANYNEHGLIEDDESTRWKFKKNESKGCEATFVIEIPTEKRLAAIIDGQHRVNGFKNATSERLDEMELLVAIFFDLPNPYQAYLFATINYNQKPVNKSLALEQFGYFTEVKKSLEWSPELLAVHFSRRLNTEENSTFFNHIKVAPQNDEYLLENNQKEMDWLVSTATVVDGILGLITSNPKEDSNELRRMFDDDRNRNKITRSDNSPLRDFYLETNDLFIYKTIFNFFKSFETIILENVIGINSYIKKTVGIQAIFNVLKEVLKRNLEVDKNISKEYFDNIIGEFSQIDFTDNFFTASGLGKSRIQNTIFLVLNYKSLDEIRNPNDRDEYTRIIG